MAGNHSCLSINGLNRRPVLTAMIVYSLVYGVAAAAVWWEVTGNPTAPKCEDLYLAQNSPENHPFLLL
jgi:hypothetical protein